MATRGAIGFGESYMAGEWDADDLAGLLELLLPNASAAVERHRTLGGYSRRDRGRTAATGGCAPAATSPTTTTSATSSSR